MGIGRGFFGDIWQCITIVYLGHRYPRHRRRNHHSHAAGCGKGGGRITITGLCDAALSGGADGWVSVEDGLPEKLTIVLVDGPNYSVRCAYYQNGFWSFASGGHVLAKAITHWRPLPPPPKEVKA